MYYLRTKPAVDAIKFTVDKQQEVPKDEFKAMIERARVGEGDDDDCEMCSG